MEWIRDNTPTDAKLVVLGDTYIREWAPHVSRRTVLNVFQGLEWQPKKQAEVLELNQALAGCEEWGCVSSQVAAAPGYDEVYVYVEIDQFPHLLTSLTDETAAFRIMWQNEVVAFGYLRTLEH